MSLIRAASLLALGALTVACPLTAPGLVPVDCAVDEDCEPDEVCGADGLCLTPVLFVDAGLPPPDVDVLVDGGAPPAPDAGAPFLDAGEVPADAGAPPLDAGFDAGFDAGPQPGCLELTQAALELACDGCLRVVAERITTSALLDTFVADNVNVGDAGPPPCWCAVGTIDLDGSTLADLSPLSSFSPLKGITGGLRIDQVTATDLTGLDEVEAVGGNLDILASASLNTLNFDALEYVAGDLSLTGMPVSSISGPEALREVCGSLDLGVMSSANTLDGFNALERTGGLTTGTMGALGSITGLTSLREVDGDLELGALTSMNSIPGLTALERVGGTLSLAGDASLNSVAGLTSLRVIEGDLTMTGLGSLNTLAGFSSLAEIGGFWDLTGATSLPNLDGLESLRRAGQIKLETMSSLSSIEGLSALEEVTGEFKIKDNQITAVEGLDALTTTAHLRIEGTGTQNIRGFRRLTALGDLTHTGNALRPRCYADRLVAQATDVLPVSPSITNNTLPCSFHLDTFGDGELATNPEPGIGWTLVSGAADEAGGIIEATPTLADPVILVVPDPDAYYASLDLTAVASVAATRIGDGAELELACVDPATPLVEVSGRDNNSTGIYARVRVTPTTATVALETLVPGAGSISSTSIGALSSLELDFDGVNAVARVGGTERADDMSAAGIDRCRLVLTLHALGADPPEVQIFEVRVDTRTP